MELNDLYTVDAHGAGAEMRVIDQYGKDSDFYIRLVGVDSTKWANIKREFSKSLASVDTEKPTEIESLQAGMLSAAVVGWRGFKNKGEDIKFTEAKAKELFTQAPYIADQADRFIADRVNFMKG